MSGTLFGLGLSQPVDLNGKPMPGCGLYVYTAGAFTTPVTTYKDFALTAGQEHPFPIPSDAFGRLPIFWIADGNYAFRLTDQFGVVIASSLNVQALGPSSGGGGGGGSVDPNALFKTGFVMFQDKTGTLSGFVRDNARTIGSATSGATERAALDCQACYEDLWNTFDNTICPVTGGRGGSSAADWAANKPIQLPDKRGCGPVGLDDMGNSAASRFTGVPFTSGNATTPGSICGENTHTLSTPEIPSHNHTVTDPGHTHATNPPSPVLLRGDINTGSGFTASTAAAVGLSINSATTGISLAAAGGGGAHNTVARSITGTWYRKL